MGQVSLPWGASRGRCLPTNGPWWPLSTKHSQDGHPHSPYLPHLAMPFTKCSGPLRWPRGGAGGLFIYGLQCSGMPGGTLEAKWGSLKMHPRTSPRLWVTHSDLQGPSRMNHRAPTRTWLILPSLQPPNKQVKRGWLTCLRPHSPWLS